MRAPTGAHFRTTFARARGTTAAHLSLACLGQPHRGARGVSLRGWKVDNLQLTLSTSHLRMPARAAMRPCSEPAVDRTP